MEVGFLSSSEPINLVLFDTTVSEMNCLPLWPTPLGGVFIGKNYNPHSIVLQKRNKIRGKKSLCIRVSYFN